jgi:cytidylate kinase
MVVARLVSEGLKIELFDDNRLHQEAIKMGILAEDIKELGGKAPGLFDRLLRNRSELYLDYMEVLIYEVAKKGEGVIIGHGSQMLLRDFECALHVHIYAGESTRIQNLVTQKGLNEEASRKLIRRSDHEQKGFFSYSFHMDWSDPSLYDLIINTEQIGLDLTAKIIMDVARSDRMKACSLAAVESMERLGLKKKVHAALLKEGISLMLIEVLDKGVVEVYGVARSKEEEARISRIVKGIPGVSEVLAHIGVYNKNQY